MNVGARRRARAEFMRETAEGGLNILRAFHAHLVALGTNPRWAGIEYQYSRAVVYGRRKKRGKGRIKLFGAKDYKDQDFSYKYLFGDKPIRYTGVMPADRFIREAAEAAEQRAIDAIRRTTLLAIEAETRKAGGK